jgi:anti-sigma regulatory factor (Ser/Thr protein kinase)
MHNSLEHANASRVVSDLRLAARPSHLGLAREYAHGAASAFGLPSDDCYDFAYAVNEAVTNAVRHGGPDEFGQIGLSVVADDNRLTLAVHDYGSFVLPIRESDASSNGGRGFVLMAALTDDVQLSIGAWGTIVYLSKDRP